MTRDDAFIASARRAERDAIRAAAGRCAGLNILDAGSKMRRPEHLGRGFLSF